MIQIGIIHPLFAKLLKNFELTFKSEDIAPGYVNYIIIVHRKPSEPWEDPRYFGTYYSSSPEDVLAKVMDLLLGSE